MQLGQRRSQGRSSATATMKNHHLPVEARRPGSGGGGGEGEQVPGEGRSRGLVT